MGINCFRSVKCSFFIFFCIFSEEIMINYCLIIFLRIYKIVKVGFIFINLKNIGLDLLLRIERI